MLDLHPMPTTYLTLTTYPTPSSLSVCELPLATTPSAPSPNLQVHERFLFRTVPHSIVASFLLWLLCRQWQLGGALSVEMRYGGVCDLLVALATCSLPRHHHLLLLLLLWTATVACGIAVSFLSRLVLLVCAVVVVHSQMIVAGGGSWWRRLCCR